MAYNLHQKISNEEGKQNVGNTENIESSTEEINKLYETIQKEKEEKLKEYREKIIKMKKDKRDLDLFGAGEEEDKVVISNVSDDNVAKKRLEMRKSLADKLKTKK